MQGQDDEVDDQLQHTEYRVYKSRFMVLIAFCSFSLMQSWGWFTYAGFADATVAFYEVPSSYVSWYLFVGPAVYIVGTPLFIWLLDKDGIRSSVVLGASCVLCGAILRVLSLFIPPIYGWPIVLIGQAFTSLAGVPAMATPPKLSSIWFAPHERAASTSFGVVVNNCGTAGGFLLGLVCQSSSFVSSRSCVSFQLYLQLGGAILSAFLVWIFVWDQPPTPSSPATDRSTLNIAMGASIRSVLSNPSFVFLVLAAGCSQGIFSTWAGLLDLILVDVPPGQRDWLGFGSNVAGVLGGLCLGGVASVVRLRYKAFMVTLFALSGVCFVLFNLFVSHILPYSLPAVAATLLTGSFLIYACNPLFYEMAVEMAYPAPEGLVGAIVSVLINLFGMPVYPIQNQLPPTVINWVNAGNSIFFAVTMLFMRESYRRDARDQLKSIQ